MTFSFTHFILSFQSPPQQAASPPSPPQKSPIKSIPTEVVGKEQNNERDIDEKSKNFTTNNISDTNDLPAAAAAIASSSTPPPVKRPSGNIQLSELIDDAITAKHENIAAHNAPSSTKMSKNR